MLALELSSQPCPVAGMKAQPPSPFPISWESHGNYPETTSPQDAKS